MTDIALQVDQTRAEGLIGASDAGAILGLDPYRSPMDVWLELTTGEKKERPAFVQEAAEWGQALEPVVRGKYALDKHCMIMVPHESLTREEWLRCTPDGFVEPTTHTNMVGVGSSRDLWSVSLPLAIRRMANLGTCGLLQVKTCSAYKRDEWADGKVPAAYEIQCRVEMAVCELPWNDIACLIGGQEFVVRRIERDSKLEARILGELRAFWERVKSKTPPDVDGSAAWRDFASSRMRPTKVAIAADESTVDLLAEWKRLRSEREALEQAEAEIKTSLLLKMSAAGATKITAGIGDVSAYLAGGRTDFKGWAMELAKGEAVPERFKKPSTTWALKVPKQWSNDDDAE